MANLYKRHWFLTFSFLSKKLKYSKYMYSNEYVYV